LSTIVDTNVILDIVTPDGAFREWSTLQMEQARERGLLVINAVVYAELSYGYSHPPILDGVLEELGVILEDIPRPALFLAAKAFLSYRKSGGIRTGVLPDFFIGAHAQVAGHTLLSRDRGRYSAYFPDVALIIR